MITLSIIIPVYKVEDYVGQCLQSVFDGGHDESLYEVIVVNDGTPDKSMDVVRRVCAGHDNVKIIEQDNQGLSAARMAGLAKAEGEYVWFVDSDDWLEIGAVDIILKILSKNTLYSVYIMPLIWTGTRENRCDYVIDEDIPFFNNDVFNTGFPLPAIQRYVIHHELLKEDGVYFPLGLIHEDEYFYRVVLYRASSVLTLKSPLYYYRQRDNSIMNSRTIQSFYDIVSIYRQLQVFRKSIVSLSDQGWFQRDISSFLLRGYKDSYMIPEGYTFRRKYRWFVFAEGMKCGKFSLKEKAWIVGLLFFSRVLRIVTRAERVGINT